MLRASIATICFLALLGLGPQGTNNPNWRQIVPGRSTKSDVEKLLGVSDESYSAGYDLADGTLSVIYSAGPCGAKKIGGWNLPKDTVTTVTFTPTKKVKIGELHLDRSKFRKIVGGGDVGGVTYYTSDKDSITYEVQQGRVDSVTYEPPMNLYCGDEDLTRRPHLTVTVTVQPRPH